MASKTKKQQVTESKNKASVEKASGLKIDQALNSLTKAGLEIQQTLSGVSAGLIEKYSDLKAVEDSISLKKAELSALHDADKILLSIDELKAEHEKEVQRLEQERQDIENANIQLRQDIEETRRRQQAEFDYNLAQARKQDNDQYLETVRQAKLKEQIRQEEFERDIERRQNELKLKEAAYNDAFAKNATFEAEVEARTKAEVGKATAIQRKDFEHEKQLSAIQHKAELDKTISNNQVLAAQLADKEKTIQELQDQLKAAHAANTSLAAKAVEAGNNKQAQADALALVTNIGGNGQRPARS